MNKIGAIVLVSFGFLLSCAGKYNLSRASDILSLQDALRSPDEFDGKEISVCGWFSVDMEICMLAEPPGSYLPGEIWILPSSDICTPKKSIKQPLESWAIISGVFRTNGGFGHFGEYEHLIEASKIEIRNDGCPNK